MQQAWRNRRTGYNEGHLCGLAIQPGAVRGSDAGAVRNRQRRNRFLAFPGGGRRPIGEVCTVSGKRGEDPKTYNPALEAVHAAIPKS